MEYWKLVWDYYCTYQDNPPIYEKREFLEKYRCSVLCIDNIPDMTAAPRVQEKMVQLLNLLNAKVVIFGLEKHLDETKLGERFMMEAKERFTVRVEEIKAPDFDMKLTILKDKLKKNDFILKEDTMKKVVLAYKGDDTNQLLEYYDNIVEGIKSFHLVRDELGTELWGQYAYPTDADSVIMQTLQEMKTK